MPNRRNTIETSLQLRLSFLFFFVSGFCGLVYQIVWVRMAFMYFGIIPPVLSVVIAVFMLGLGLGSWWSGKMADWWMRRRGFPVLGLYALTEALVGLTAWQVPHLFALGSRMLWTMGAMNSAPYLFASAVLMTLAILPACTCMGATIPIMMCHIAPAGETDRGFSYLYLANVMGAFCGTVLSAAVLIELLGFRNTLQLAVALNLLLAFLAGGLIFLLPDQHLDRNTASLARFSDTTPARFTFSCLILFTTGLVSMGCEVLWTRAFTPIIGTTIYAFATVLAAFLFGTGLGSFAYRWQLRRKGHRVALSVDQTLIGVALSVFIPVLWNDPRLNESSIGVALSLLPFCALLGYLTPRLVDEYAGGNARAAGWAYAINIMGCILGPLLSSYLLLPWVGVRIGTLCLASLFLILLALQYQRSRGKVLIVALISGGLFAATVLFVSHSYEEDPPWSFSPKIIHRDYAATVISFGSGMDMHLFVNGVGITTLTPLTKMMAHLPVRAYPGHPHNALLICFGMGTTFRSLLSWGLQTTAVELVPSVLRAFPYYYADAAAALQNPLSNLVIDDGRRFLHRTTDLYDIITLDPPPPVETAGSGLLYSPEFYEQLKQHLRARGIVQQWWPAGELKILLSVVRSIHESFPYVRVFKGRGDVGFHFLASMTPIQLRSADDFIAEMPASARRDFLEWNQGLTLRSQVLAMTDHEIPLEKLLTNPAQPLITDDAPFNEYYYLRRLIDGHGHTRHIFYVK